jgi:2-polyprenyl-3-methyl-5-hydroxy-6-metoxy-1,4-benzoquinol methylase
LGERLDARIARIREEERKYHEACYAKHALFEAGSWLQKPVLTVLETFRAFDAYGEVTVLDLGCGVGRNSIPLAQALKGRGGRVVGVDIMDTALAKLKEYGTYYGVRDYIETCESDIGSFEIPEQSYDYIVAVSALEHVESERIWRQVLERMRSGVRESGIVCIIMSTNIRETDAGTGETLETLMELNLRTEQAVKNLEAVFTGWSLLYSTVKPLRFDIERGERKVILSSDCLSFVVRR